MVFSKTIPTDEVLRHNYGNYPRIHGISETTKKRFQEILDKLEPYRKTNKMLDVGCGEGFFLVEALKRGWDVYGTEFNPAYIEDGKKKGIRMFAGKIGSIEFEHSFFDVIISIEVLEHLQQPAADILQFNKLLREGGAVYVTTPNFNALSRRMLGAHWSIISYPDHLCYFTSATLNFLMKTHGFNNLYIKTEGISIDRISQFLRNKKTAVTTTENRTVRSLDQHLQEKFENRYFLRIMKKIINRVLTFTGSGDGIKALFIKTKSITIPE
ncbi:MAG TPA: class I SAM-dependent methyltransferase [Bacteroidia bacterium]|nr:class I SAM-dependent methyltransferase [Bacteroidia bacterium]